MRVAGCLCCLNKTQNQYVKSRQDLGGMVRPCRKTKSREPNPHHSYCQGVYSAKEILFQEAYIAKESFCCNIIA